MLPEFINFGFTTIKTHLPQNTHFIKNNTGTVTGPKSPLDIIGSDCCFYANFHTSYLFEPSF
jgi:hypothetical protein